MVLLWIMIKVHYILDQETYTNHVMLIGKGLRSLINKIDKDSDWIEFVRLCSDRSGRIQKNDYLSQDHNSVSVELYFF